MSTAPAVDLTIRPCLHPRAGHEHGTYLAHDRDGCRCGPCVAASRRHHKATAYRTATGTSSYVDAGPAREHVLRLLGVLTARQIEARSGVHRTAIRVLVGDFPGRPRSKRITRTTEAALLAVRADRVGNESSGLVDATGTRRRLQALVALGWPVSHLRARVGASSRTTWLLTSGGGAASDFVTVRLRDAVLSLYDELSMTLPAPGRGATRARGMAAARGWAPPLAWDDDSIDDPSAAPQRGVPGDVDSDIDEVIVERVLAGDRMTLSRSARGVVVARLAEAGESDRQIAARLGVVEMTVLRDRQRLGIESRWVA
jgi:hypothetical protein